MAGNRIRGPELEHEFVRDPRLGYEPEGSYGYVRYIAHGFPNPLVRWHYHEEYELHLIVTTSGKAFVGDYIGQFEPGHLVLTGPRLPHNWISTDAPPEGVPLRDMLLQFRDEALRKSAEVIPELAEALPMLERARHGIEFFGVSEVAQARIEYIQRSRGLRRLSQFIDLLGELVACTDYRLLSNVQLQSVEDDTLMARISPILAFIAEHCTEELDFSELARRAGMSESKFSRFFRRATGNTFTDFITRLRINKACQLLMETDHYIGNVCYEVGFKNVANFNRRFFEIKGVTPGEYRRQSSARFGR